MYLSNGTPKAIAIFVSSFRIGDEPISNEYYWECYQDLMLSLKARGIEAYLTSGNETYLGSGVFSRALAIESKVADPRFLNQLGMFTLTSYLSVQRVTRLVGLT